MSCQKNFKGGDEDKSCLNQNLEKEMLDKQSIYIFKGLTLFHSS